MLGHASIAKERHQFIELLLGHLFYDQQNSRREDIYLKDGGLGFLHSPYIRLVSQKYEWSCFCLSRKCFICLIT